MNFFRKFFIPESGNSYKPHFFKESSLAVLTLLVLIVFGATLLGRTTFFREDFLAAILPGVLTDLANVDRSAQNIGSLTLNPTLQKAAQLKANDMAAKGYFAHNSPDGLTPWHWFKEAGYDFTYAGENLAVNFGDSVDVNRAWMNSPGHRANLLNGKFTEIGIATADGIYEGRPTIYVVELFGRPAAKSVSTQVSTSTKAATSTPTKKTGITVVSSTSTFETVASSSVLGESGTNEMFVAVENESAVASPGKLVKTPYSTFLERIAASPQNTLGLVYTALALLLVLALMLTIFIEIRRQHPVHILYALLILSLIGVLFYLYRAVLFAPLLIM